MHTLKVARDDLWNNLCPRFLYNTTLKFPSFTFPLVPGDVNIRLSYGCTLNQLPEKLPYNVFNCTVSQTNSFSFYLEPDNQATCNGSILVPVNRSMLSSLTNPTATSTTLSQALEGGFSIQWWADNDNCNLCKQSGGVCGYNQGSDSFSWYCTDRPHDLTCDGTRPGDGGGLSVWQKYVIIGVCLAITGIVTSFITIFFIKKQHRVRKLDQESNQNINKFLLTHGSLAPKRYSYCEIKKITKSLTDKLGQGGCGIVYKGELLDGQLVAVKVLTETDKNGEELINEVASISGTSHVNIVNLLEFCYERKKRALVYEYMPNRSLDKFIYSSGSLSSDASLEWEKLYDIAVGIARGLVEIPEYLHRGCNIRIVHFDIKPQNIILDEDFCSKIFDFGLAKLFKQKKSIISMLGTRGTVGYIAPEVFSRNFGGVSHKSDVYSYGMMLLEMAGARKNLEIEAIQSSEDYFADKIYEHVLLENKKLDDLRTEVNEETARQMLLVGLWCNQTAPSDRPLMTKVVEMLVGNLQSIQIPPKPVLSTPRLLGRQISSSFSVNVEAES
ncbi:Serine/threonine protein kinase [Handroanthus impetiginosus]|uniref:Serine/threonine protein kinase n=1 Tax=Handroanthus impetiginosus TaxID=429701 RepID=A0A2G9GJW7_9LAMI|nr:Serine/threonine protein kinase [Handroanthus impetiginosus]